MSSIWIVVVDSSDNGGGIPAVWTRLVCFFEGSGVISTGSELASCKDGSDKRAWYSAQQTLRNSIDRNYDVRMDKSLSELPGSGLGVKEIPNVSIKNYLNSI